jgi:hypothetical protein
MSVTSNRTVQISFSSDVEYTQDFDAAVNASGSGQIQLVNLTTGANTITVPTNAVAVTIIPPALNAVTITLKGVTGDTGIALNLTDPTSIGLSSVSTFCLTAGNSITGVRLIYS